MKVIEVNIELAEQLSTQQKNSFWDNFISQVIEANNLQYGGLGHGFVESGGEFEINESHKHKIVAWLKDQKNVKKYDLQIINDGT